MILSIVYRVNVCEGDGLVEMLLDMCGFRGSGGGLDFFWKI